MRLQSAAIFFSGVVFATGIIGTTTWLQAENANVVSTCANKKTGVLRYITKGVCNKKTETAVSWGTTGPTGPQGLKGENGAKGETGTNGQNIHVIDATGRDFGLAFGVDDSGARAVIRFEDGYWSVSNAQSAGYEVSGTLNASGYFSDNSCTQPYVYNLPPDSSRVQTANLRGVYRSSAGSTVGFKLTGAPFLGSTLTDAYQRVGPVVNSVRTCVALNNPTYSDFWSEFAESYYSSYTTVTIPPVVAPFSLVQK